MIQKHFGFTLIELLIVMAIIALLAALLFPVFAHARGKGYQTACASNLKQIGLAAAEYSQDNEGLMFPALGHAYDNGTIVTWGGCKVERPTPRFDTACGRLSAYVKNKSLWNCPAAPNAEFTYGLNIAYARTEIAQKHPVSVAQIGDPAGTILVADHVAVAPSDLELPPSVYMPSDKQAVVAGRHFGRANVLWADDHVTARHPVASFAYNSYSTGPLTVKQLQQRNQGDILRVAYTGNPDQDNYYYALSKAVL